MREILAILFLCFSAVAQSCSNASTTYQLQQTAVGWQFCPNGGGSAVCKSVASSCVDLDLCGMGSFKNAITTKYGSLGTWASKQSSRLSNLGFTTAGYYSIGYGKNWSGGMLPNAVTWNGPSLSALNDTKNGVAGGPYNVKNITRVPYPGGMKCGANIIQGDTVDPYDSNTQAAFTDSLACGVSGGACGAGGYGTEFAHTIMFIPDEADFLFAFDKANTAVNSHPDGALYILAGSPFRIKSACTNCAQQGTVTFSNSTFQAKLALRDYLKTLYSNSLSSLNTAWGTSYTTFDTSDAGGLSSIATAGGNAVCTAASTPYACCTGNGTGTCTQYQSWGGNGACLASGTPYACCSGNGAGTCTQGTGFLDENGNNVISNSQACGGRSGNGPEYVESWATNAQIETDVHGFLNNLAAKYAQEIQTGWKAACGSTCPPEALPVYDAPPAVYAAQSQYTDLFWTAPGEYDTIAHAITDVQNILNQATAPIIVANYYHVKGSDSYIGGSCAGFDASDCTTTQAARVTNWTTLQNGVLRMKNLNSKFAVVGFDHWQWYDNASAGKGYGLFTPNDNGYDGSQASTVNTSPAWQSAHAYTAPVIVSDGTNKQSLRVASCTSGGSAPTWNTNYQGQTTDGTCKWFNIGSYALTAETGNFGDLSGPIADFNLGNLCDPPTGSAPTRSMF